MSDWMSIGIVNSPNRKKDEIHEVTGWAKEQNCQTFGSSYKYIDWRRTWPPVYICSSAGRTAREPNTGASRIKVGFYFYIFKIVSMSITAGHAEYVRIVAVESWYCKPFFTVLHEIFDSNGCAWFLILHSRNIVNLRVKKVILVNLNNNTVYIQVYKIWFRWL